MKCKDIDLTAVALGLDDEGSVHIKECDKCAREAKKQERVENLLLGYFQQLKKEEKVMEEIAAGTLAPLPGEKAVQLPIRLLEDINKRKKEYLESRTKKALRASGTGKKAVEATARKIVDKLFSGGGFQAQPLAASPKDITKAKDRASKSKKNSKGKTSKKD